MMWLFGMAAAVSGAAGTPAYLACSLQQETGALAVEVIADEANQQAIVSLPSTGRVVTRKALFSPAEVRIMDEESTWRVDRVNLAFERVMIIGDMRWTEQGKCALKPVPEKRAF